METNNAESSLKERVLEMVAQIPAGKVMYFGQISNMVGGSARTVGWILSGLTLEECDLVPWYRVVAKSGYISSLKLGIKGVVQKEKLEQEGYELKDDFVDMEKHLWLIEQLN
ncbi:MAG: MGMT family protein [Patescibacteria group bacterium]